MTASGSRLAKVEAAMVRVIKNKPIRVERPPRIRVMGLSFHTPLLLVQLNQLVEQTLMHARKVTIIEATIILDPATTCRNPRPHTDLM